MSIVCHLLISADYSSVGRLDKASFSDQTLMELFLGESTERTKFHESEGAFKHISQWNGLRFDDSDHVTGFDFHRFSTSALFQLEWIPETVYSCEIENNGFEKEIQWGCLPAELHLLNIEENRLFGSLPLGDLPFDIWVVCLAHNSLTGTLDFSQVPGQLEYLDLRHNSFNGTISLITITRSIGEVDWSRLDTFYDDNRKPDGEVVFDVYLSENSFENNIYVYELALCDERMHLPHGSRIIDTKGNERTF